MRVVFMGTPDFAAASLKAMIDDGIDIVGVYTQPDRPRNRMKKSDSPVKETALRHGIPVFQPERLRDEGVLAEYLALQPDLFAVVAYGKILTDGIIRAPKYGGINLHASLLPKYRGASPIQTAVLNGDKTTGVTTMYVEPELDSGDLIYTVETEIGEFETSGELFCRLRGIGAELMVKTVRDIESGVAPRRAQEHDRASYTARLTKDMSPIDWSRAPREIVKHICGLDPWPVATTALGDVTLRVFGAAYTENTTREKPGTVVYTGRDGIELACGGGKTLLLTRVQAPGGKRMAAGDYILGHPLGGNAIGR